MSGPCKRDGDLNLAAQVHRRDRRFEDLRADLSGVAPRVKRRDCFRLPRHVRGGKDVASRSCSLAFALALGGGERAEHGQHCV